MKIKTFMGRVDIIAESKKDEKILKDLMKNVTVDDLSNDPELIKEKEKLLIRICN